MRYAFIRALHELAQADARIHLLTGDLGFTVVEDFAAAFPDRFLNLGVAEANLIGVAAGLARSGKIPFTYSIATFMTSRCFEQIRLDVCAQDAHVRIVGIGGGFAYGNAGPTHHALEDIALMRLLPGMTVVCPADPLETDLATRAAVAWDGPLYLRLGKGGDPVVHGAPPAFAIGEAIPLRQGNEVALLATGSLVHATLLAAHALEEQGVSSLVASVHTVKPLDERFVIQAARQTGTVVTIEEHSIVGGLGDAVGHCLAQAGLPVRLLRIGVDDQFSPVVGDQDFIRESLGLSPIGLVRRVLPLVRR